MPFRLVAPLLCVWALCAPPLLAQEDAASPPADVYAQIPVLGESGEKKLANGDTHGAIDDFRKAFEGSRTLTSQYPDEPAYRENAHYYLGRLAAALGSLDQLPAALQMAEQSARGYAEMASAEATAENKQKAADALTRLAWFQILSNDGAAAEVSARQALALSPGAPVMQVNLAHALLLQGHPDEARAIYRHLRDATAAEGRSMREIILEDFDAMQKAGVSAESIAPLRAELGGRSRNAPTSIFSLVLIWVSAAFVLAGVATVFAIFIYREQKRTAALAAKARSLGLTFRRKATAEDKQLIAGSNLTTTGRARQVRNVIEVPQPDGTRMTLFDFSYAVGTGKSNRTYRQTVARFQSPLLNLPSFELRPESMMLKIAASLGMKDIDLEGWPNFSKMYLLRGDDEAAIRRVFSPDVLRYCEANRGLWISGAGELVWFHRQGLRVKPDGLEAFAIAARQTFTLFTNGQTTAAPPPLPSV